MQAAEAAEQADYQAVAHWLLSLAAGNRSDLATAKRHVDLAVARASTGQLVHLLGVLGLFQARMYLLAGRLDEAVARADAAMYEAKRQHFESQGHDRRQPRG